MRKIIATSTALALCAGFTLASVAVAAKPSTGCPSTASADLRERVYFIVNVDEWWMRTVDGMVAAGIPVYVGGGYSGEFTQEFNDWAAAYGLVDGAGAEEFVRITQWIGIDKNANGLVCMKERPITPGNPAYYFNGVDDQSSSPNG